MAIEFELKYRATPEVLAQLRRDVAGDETAYQMATTYYDTPSGALSGRHYTLRRRLENEKSICTLKAPIDGPGRGEWEVSCGDIQKAIPLLIALGAPGDLETLTAEGIAPVCGARFTRYTKSLALAQGRAELALDQGILHGGSRELALCEVELELKEGTVQELELFARYFAQRYQLTPEPESKFRRALALYKGEAHV